MVMTGLGGIIKMVILIYFSSVNNSCILKSPFSFQLSVQGDRLSVLPPARLVQRRHELSGCEWHGMLLVIICRICIGATNAKRIVFPSRDTTEVLCKTLSSKKNDDSHEGRLSFVLMLVKALFIGARR